MAELKIRTKCMSLAGVMGDESVDIEEWEDMAEEIFDPPPFCDRMRPGQRLLDYGKHLGKDYALVCFAWIDEKLVGYTWGYPVNEQELQIYSSGATELTQYSQGVETLWLVDTTGVLKAFRGHGVMRALALPLIETVRGFGFTYMVSRTEVDSVRKMRKELGSEQTGIFDQYYKERDYYVLAL